MPITIYSALSFYTNIQATPVHAYNFTTAAVNCKEDTVSPPADSVALRFAELGQVALGVPTAAFAVVLYILLGTTV